MHSKHFASASDLLYTDLHLYMRMLHAIPDQEDVPDPEERDEPSPLEQGDPTINLHPIPDRGFPGEDERLIEDKLYATLA